jgi:hypothetical protein
MPSYGEVGVQTIGTQFHTSPAVFRDCPFSELIDSGAGDAVFDDFAYSNLSSSNSTTLAFWNSSSTNSGGFTLLAQTTANHANVLTTGATSGNYTALWGAPGATIIPNSSNRFWFEANIAKANTATVESVFVGLVSQAGLLGNFISGSGSLAAQTTLTSSASFVGFLSNGTPGGSTTTGGLTNFNTVYANYTGTITLTTISTNVLTQGVVDNPANLDAVNINPTTPAGSLTNNGFVKLGMRYDGVGTLEFYINGNLQARFAVAGLLDASLSYGPWLGVTAGTANASSVTVDWIKYAYESGGLTALLT